MTDLPLKFPAVLIILIYIYFILIGSGEGGVVDRVKMILQDGAKVVKNAVDTNGRGS